MFRAYGSGVWVFGCLGVCVFGCLGVQVFGCSGVQVCRCAGVQVFKCLGLTVQVFKANCSGVSGLMTFWKVTKVTKAAQKWPKFWVG